MVFRSGWDSLAGGLVVNSPVFLRAGLSKSLTSLKTKFPRVSFSRSLLLGPMGGPQVGGFKSGTLSVVYTGGVLAKTLSNTMPTVPNPD